MTKSYNIIDSTEKLQQEIIRVRKAQQEYARFTQ